MVGCINIACYSHGTVRDMRRYIALCKMPWLRWYTFCTLLSIVGGGAAQGAAKATWARPGCSPSPPGLTSVVTKVKDQGQGDLSLHQVQRLVWLVYGAGNSTGSYVILSLLFPLVFPKIKQVT